MADHKMANHPMKRERGIDQVKSVSIDKTDKDQLSSSVTAEDRVAIGGEGRGMNT